MLSKISVLKQVGLSVRNFSTSARLNRRVLTLDKINQQIRQAEYAVRGAIPIKAEELKADLQRDPSSHPFEKIIQCNIGNPQELQQKPISFVRQVSALVDYPDLMLPENLENTKKLFPQDAIDRANGYFQNGLSSAGSYTHSQGLSEIRKNVAKFVEERDGFKVNPDDIFLTNGASAGVTLMLQMLTATPKCGVMIPIPQYPLYTATLSLVNGIPVPYFLEEENGWAMNPTEMAKSLQQARDLGIDVRALVVINPGNPTGQTLSYQNMEEIIHFCRSQHLVLLADEVYQSNIYEDDLPFHSFKKVKLSMGIGYDDVELISFHSTSKGFLGECGKRGGYMELCGIDSEVQAEMYKAASIQLCPNVIGQITTDVMVKPPAKGDESYENYCTERDTIINSLKRRSQKLVAAFNKLEGVSCTAAQGAMYTFPTITLPEKAIAKAKMFGQAPDAYYCMQLLEKTGVCVVPGSGFRQKENTFHFRCTFLPKEEEFDGFIAKISQFHEEFMTKYK